MSGPRVRASWGIKATKISASVAVSIFTKTFSNLGPVNGGCGTDVGCTRILSIAQISFAQVGVLYHRSSNRRLFSLSHSLPVMEDVSVA